MNIAIIGRTEILYKTVEYLLDYGHNISLIITSKEAPEYTKTSKDFQLLAKSISAKYLYTSELGLSENIEFISKCENIDIGISLNYSSIISQEVIDLFPLGVLNAHGGDLPRYRGNACQAWAILNGEGKIGLCIHSMIGGEIDSGNIINRKYLNIDIDTKITTVYKWFYDVIPTMFFNSISKLENDPGYILEKQSKNPKDSIRCYPRVPEDGKIDWSKSNSEILRLINASNKPFSGAYCFYNGDKLIIWDAKIVEDSENYLSQAGQVASINRDGSVVVVTGQGKLKIIIIEYNGYFGSPNTILKSIRNRLV